jgi:hypothetical protein
MASLLEILLSHRVISADQAREAATLAEETGAFIGRILVAQGAVEEETLAEFLLNHCTVRPVQGELDLEKELVNLLPERLVRRYRIVPLRQDAKGVLSLAVTHPLSIGGLDQVKRRLGFPMKLVLVDTETAERLLTDATALGTEMSVPEEQTLVGEAVASDQSAEGLLGAVGASEAEEAAHGAQIEAETAIPSSVLDGGTPYDERGEEIGQRSPENRVQYPVSWKPEEVTGDLSKALAEALSTLKSIVEGTDRRYAVLVGSDADRDVVLRMLFTTVLPSEDGRYVNLLAFRYPDDESSELPAALVIDGLDAVSYEDEEEHRALLRDISRAFSSRIPCVAGIRKPPTESKSLPSGLKLTLGLGTLVIVKTDEGFIHADRIEGILHNLIEETVQWSDTVFPGAGLRSLLSTVNDAYQAGSKAEAVAKGGTAVASRIARLTKE